jgi:hypothetical protein
MLERRSRNVKLLLAGFETSLFHMQTMSMTRICMRVFVFICQLCALGLHAGLKGKKGSTVHCFVLLFEDDFPPPPRFLQKVSHPSESKRLTNEKKYNVFFCL